MPVTSNPSFPPLLSLAHLDPVWQFNYETAALANVSLCEHFGFKVVEQLALPGTPVTVWGLCRAACPAYH